MRLGCLLVSAALLASLILEPPKAKAFALTSSAVTALAGGFLNACGLAPVVSGMSSSGDVNEALARMIQEYLTAERPGVDIISWLGNVAIQVNSGNKLIIPAVAVGALTEFAKWVASKYGPKPGEDPGENVVFSDLTVPLANGGTYYLSWVKVQREVFELVTPYYYGDPPVVFSTGYSLVTDDGDICLKDPSGKNLLRLVGYTGQKTYLGYDYSTNCVCYINYGVFAGQILGSLSDYHSELFLVGSSLNSLTIDVAETMQEILDRLGALEEGQSVALDVGAEQAMGIEDILQGILDAILAGDLAASAEIVDAADVPVEPDPPVVPVVPEGLDKLGAALTSRFPFSIPWDVYKGVNLLAAPAKAPYFEVDFMAPIADRVGGWKGSTKIVLDMSEYEIIGQICRWASTIGFCLTLASGTKRLIWTA